MDNVLFDDKANIENILDAVKNAGVNYFRSIDNRPVGISEQINSLADLPQQGMGAQQALIFFNENFLPNIVASSGSRYWGFVTGGTTPAAIAGDWLTSIFDQNTQSFKGNGDISAMLEMHTINMMLELFGLPQEFIGGFVTGATMSNFTGLAVSRQWLGKQMGFDIAKDGLQGDLTIYTAVPHSSSVKSLSMLGIGSKNIISVPVLPGRECMDIEALEQMIGDSNKPFILLTSGGTVNTVDFDDMRAIARLKSKYNFWWHVDAAFGGFAACSPLHKHLLEGWELADSITIDNHKWMNVPYDSAVIFTRKEHAVLQVETFQNSNAPYLGDPLENFTYLNYLPENSRRFRALSAWFSLMAYGIEGYRYIVENSIRLAKKFGSYIDASQHFVLTGPVRLNTVCFALKNPAEREHKTGLLLTELNRRGKVFMTPTKYNGVVSIRAAFVNWQTKDEDIDIAITELESAVKSI